MFMHTYASQSRVKKKKSFYWKSELQMFLLISGGHVGVPKQYTNMTSPYKSLQTVSSLLFFFAKLLYAKPKQSSGDKRGRKPEKEK